MTQTVTRRNQVLLVLAMVAMYFCSFFQRFAVPGPIFGDLQQAFGMTAGQVTALGSLYLLIYACLQPVVGVWADRWGGVFLVMWGGGSLVLGVFGFAFGVNEVMLYGSRAVIALGDGVMYLCVLKEVDRAFGGKSFAPVFGLACLAGSLGGVVATVPFRWMVDLAGWRWTFVLTGLIALGAYGFFLTQARRCRRLRPDAVENSAPLPLAAVRKVLGNVRNYPVMLALSFSYSVCFSLQVVIGVKFLVDRQDLTPVEGSGYTFGMLIFSLAWMLAAAPVSHHFGSRRKIFLLCGTSGALLGSVVLFCAAWGTLPGWLVLVAMCLCSLQAGNVAVTTSQLRELNHPEVIATAVGLLNSFTYLVIATLAALIGLILDAFSADALEVNGEWHYPAAAYATVFLLFILVTAGGVLCAALSRETRGERLAVG